MTDLLKQTGAQTPGPLTDPINRKLDYLRVSITDRCNLNCTYCLPASRQATLSHHDILRYEEILHLVRIFRDLGITKIRITGGEPLVRKGLLPFIARLHEVEGIRDLSMTTNGVLLLNNLEGIRAAGIGRLNISLDSLNPEIFRRITGHDVFSTVWEGICKAEQMGFHPIKINVVALRGVNDHELLEMAKLSFDHAFHIRFIEYMPIGDTAVQPEKPLYTAEISAMMASIGELVPVDREKIDGPARRYRFQQAKGEIGFISPMSHHFCDQCNRLRLTASGFLRTCLLSDRQTDLKTPLRSGATDPEIAQIIQTAIRQKPVSHQLNSGHPAAVCSRMSSIGG